MNFQLSGDIGIHGQAAGALHGRIHQKIQKIHGYHLGVIQQIQKIKPNLNENEKKKFN